MSSILELSQELLAFVKNEHLQEIKNISYQEYRLVIDKEDRFKEFSLDYPSLFNMIIDDPLNFDMKRLEYMLMMKSKIDNNEMSNEAATKEVGEHYYNEFVKNKIE